MSGRVEPRINDRDVVILGGGLAGLTASAYSGAPIYEADDAPGGVASSDTAGGFTFDRGIHILQTRNQAVLDLLAELGIRFQLHRRNSFIYSNQTYTPYPFQINTAGLPISVRAKCLWYFLLRDRHSKPKNYEEWIYGNLGKGFAETFLVPYSEKFWTIHPREMTYEWAGSRVPQPTTRQVVSGALLSKQTAIGSNAEFRYPSSGAGYGAIAAALRNRAGDVHVGHRAVLVNTMNRRIGFSNGTSVRYGILINTIPVNELISICEDAPAGVKEAASRLRTNSIVVVNLGVGASDLSGKHWVHFPERDVSFFRISYPHNFGPHLAPKGASSISAEVAYSHSRPVDKENIVDRVVEDLIRVGALGRRDPILVKNIRDIKYAYCIYDMYRKESLRTVFRWLRSVGIMPCGRYGLWTYFWGDEAILSGKKAAENVAQSKAMSTT